MGKGGNSKSSAPATNATAASSRALGPGEVWREDEGKSFKVQKSYVSKSALASIAKRTDLPAKITMAEAAKHNKRDDLWVIVDGKCYDVTRYVEHHPGGWLPMVNLGGKDATDAFANYHPARVYKNMLPQYYIGDVVDYRETEFQKGHRAIRQRLLAEGMFETRMSYYYKLTAWFAALLAGAVYCTLACTSFAAHMAGAVLLGAFWQQMAGVGHDIGHNGVTHVWKTDNTIGLLVGNFLTGIGMGWWKRSHNVHHVVCNSIENDPDIQHMPIFAVSPEIFGRFFSSYHQHWVETDAAARFLVSYQHWLFYPIMAFARFNLYAQAWLLLLSDEYVHNKKWEMVASAGFIAWLSSLVAYIPVGPWGNWERVLYLLVSHNVAGLLHVQICLSHFAMETYHGVPYKGEEDEWFRMQLATTLNIDCPAWLDWFHIGLQFQIEHHLWPRLPRHNLRYASKLVQEFCKEQGVNYHMPKWIDAQFDLVAHMKETAMKARDLKRGDAGFYESPIWEGLNAQG
eukprot:CAMPEP_0119465024 /NCGR_PEP_ID=MMETSP1344-20130328/344_1 /TAXON_ID=236787 /ORGANISM="Florenciella parvula, Strain CCMP2471" /LENGTH=512 /DNA_ID=CAMNT_0007497265 /DNA_START=85 /DNA_END=1623 /DNA_ORIENTATION=-